MDGFAELESDLVPESTREHVFERDGEQCWLCSHGQGIQVACHIDAEANNALSRFKENGTIPPIITSPLHSDNLFPLCPNCHQMYDAGFSDWALIPEKKTLQKYIDHEKIDYKRRLSASNPPPRSLQVPPIDRRTVLYHPLIITEDYNALLGPRNKFPQWPKRWLGEPTTVIHVERA